MQRKAGTGRHRDGIWRLCRSLRALKQVHSLMVVRGFLSDRHSLRELLFAAAVTLRGGMPYARQLFDDFPHPDHFMWNTIIRGAAHTSNPAEALHICIRMERGGTTVHHLALPFLLRACTTLSSPAAGCQFHAKITKLGFHHDTFVRNALIHLHATCGDPSAASALFAEPGAQADVVAWSCMVAGLAGRGRLDDARRLFDEMPERDLIAWNVMITGYCKQGQMASARELFDLMPHRDTVSWNAMISGYVRSGAPSRAMDLFDEMRAAGQQPDQVTMLGLISACADSGAIEFGRRIHAAAGASQSVVLGNALIDMYAKCGSIEGSVGVFREMRERDVATWNSVIGGLALHGDSQAAVALFEEMRGSAAVRPDEVSFVSVLVACSHGGMVEQGRAYFSLMRDEYGGEIEANVKHYGCMVDMLGRAGRLTEAFELAEEMKVMRRLEPNAVVWRALLGACRTHGEVELGERANAELLRIERDGSASGNYILLSNIYASTGEWRGVEKMRSLMDDGGVTKEAGCTHLLHHVSVS